MFPKIQSNKCNSIKVVKLIETQIYCHISLIAGTSLVFQRQESHCFQRYICLESVYVNEQRQVVKEFYLIVNAGETTIQFKIILLYQVIHLEDEVVQQLHSFSNLRQV